MSALNNSQHDQYLNSDTQSASPPGAFLEVTTSLNPEKHLYYLTLPVVSVGRHPSSDIVINEPVISGLHFQIVHDGNKYILIHPHPARQETTNGILYEGRHIRGKEPLRLVLTSGEIFRIGDQNGTLVTFTFNDGTGIVHESVPQVHPIPLNERVITIGRYSDNRVVLNHPQVSGHHAHVEQMAQGHRIIDLGSTNHVYVNGQQVTNQVLHQNDEIRIGPFRFTYTGSYLTQYDESNSIRIDALHLKKFGNKRVVLLNDISLALPARKFIAIVGGSGAGKSTLMNALSGLRPADDGVVLYNGQDYYRSLSAFSTQLGYVPQDDIVHRDLTVERALYYAAKLRLPSDFTRQQIQQRIEEVLDDVEMIQRRNLLVSKLSGGQRKRVSIALELLAKPSVFFLDEPTSGLDPGLDRKMMLLLRRLADRGHTIVLVTHATNNINACDYVCFLADGGRLAYFGPPNEAKRFFGKSDFAEIYGALDTSIDGSVAEQAENAFRASRDYQEYVVKPLNQGPANKNFKHSEITGTVARRANSWRQFSLLSLRYIELLKNDVGNLLLLILQAPIIALILMFFIQYGIGTGGFDPNNVVQCPVTVQVFNANGLPDIPTPFNPAASLSCSRLEQILTTDPRGKAYAQRRGGTRQALQDFIIPGPGDPADILLIMTFAAIMFGCINAAREIVKEAPIYRRERTVNMGIMPYMFSKIVVLGILCLLQSAILVGVVHAVDPFQHGIIFPGYIEVYITIALTALSGLMMGLTVSAIVPNNDRAMSFIPIILIPQVIFSGMLFALKELPLQIAGAIFPVRWAIAALGSTVGLHSDKLLGDKLFGDDPTYHGTLFSLFDQNDATIHLVLMWLAMLGIILFFGFVIAFFLRRKDMRR